jgi:NTP pyrophosphatase (non-canonical NTP hydrolase)
MDSLLDKIRFVNQARNKKNLDRRMMKLGEEYGEAVQAFLAVTSKRNTKQKSWPDVREELCDVVIVALDILLTEMPDEEIDPEVRDQVIEERIHLEIDRKLEKWLVKMNNRQTEVDDAE